MGMYVIHTINSHVLFDTYKDKSINEMGTDNIHCTIEI